MTITNKDYPANPLSGDAYINFADYVRLGEKGMSSYDPECQGLTKREQFCLTMGVADTGDAELDKIITKGNLQKMATQFTAALLTATDADGDWKANNIEAGRDGLLEATALLKELAK